MQPQFRSITVIGLGMIGASFAGACRRAYPDVRICAVDVDQDTLSAALETSLVDDALLADDPGLEKKLAESDLVMVSTPVPRAAEWFDFLARMGYEGVVTDTCSTKELVSQHAVEVLPHPERYVPGHPMAGSEKSGIDGSRVDLFEGAHWVLCPDEDTPVSLYADLHELLTGIGARVVSLPREKHDEAVAIISHVPHLVASSLVELAVRHADDQQSLFRLAAGGFKDSTRIAAGSPVLWTGISFDNAPAIVSGIEEMRTILGQYAQALGNEDKEGFQSLLSRAAQARRRIPAKWVPKTEDLLEVRIPLTDRPGIVAEATTIASKAGCNIQSIEIDHITSSSAELVLLLTDEGDVGKLSIELLKSGFKVSFNPLFGKEEEHDI